MARHYVSVVREEQKDATRDAIVDAATRVLCSKAPDLKIPAVARAAGVGVATVYRHFPSKDNLLDAVYDRWMEEARGMLEDVRTDREALLERLPAIWRAQAADDELERVMSIFSPVGRTVRRRRLARRRTVAAELVADVEIGDEQMRRFLQAVVLLLTSTTAHRHLREHWNMSTDEAAEAAAWAVRRLTSAAATH